MSQGQWEFWIDHGGTFTDIIGCSPEMNIVTHKLLSENPKHYSDPAVQGIREILNLKKTDPIPVDKIAAVKLGTTVATNALLERKGEKLILAVTKGFRDALRIGYQNRPNIFDLKIVLPSVLHQDVIEINERIDAQGNVVKPLDVQSTYANLKKAFGNGYKTLAIVLMHGYRYKEHEVKIADLAKQIGFSYISVSHQIAPLIKFISRGDTTVLDAYLSPVLKRYVLTLRKELKQVPIYFMQSKGGLIYADFFQGKDSIFSGPAGGVVGMVKTSESEGFNQVIGFDMGGTSTDVSHYAGEYERINEWEISGVKLRTPMMLIQTIAAGGGSILHFENLRCSVGPDSAAANPGPACYRRGGPLTITDCNVLLGKIQSDFFPKIFGESGNQALDLEKVKEKFALLTQEINLTTNDSRSPEQIAEGFLKIAIDNMANAIKKITVQRGYDVTNYILNCFGGAAGQHACAVADELGIQKVLLHPFAGVLSAYGIGLAQIRLLRERTIIKKLEKSLLINIKKSFENMKSEINSELAKQDIKNRHIHFDQYLHLRYSDSNTTFSVKFDQVNKMEKEFAEKYQKQFGIIFTKKTLLVDSISIEAHVENQLLNENKVLNNKPRKTYEIPRLKTIKIFTHNTFHEAPIYDRKILIPGDCIQGSAIICDALSTTVIEPNWQAKVTEKSCLLLTRVKEISSKTLIKESVDPVLLEVFNNRFMNIAEQMGEVLRRTASSVNIKERLDFSCAIFDRNGELVANAPHIPVHLGSMSVSIKSLLKKYANTMQPGDTYALNSPYHGGTHLPDLTVITPIFSKDKELLFLVGSRGHHADIGGITPGSVPANSHSIEEEGVLIENVKMVHHGRFLENTLLKLFTESNYPSRNPKQNIEDLKAQLAANERGISALLNLIEQFGWNIVNAYMGHVRDNAKVSVELLLSRLKNGSFCYSLDDGSEIKVAIYIDHKGKKAKFDFSGSAKQHPGNFNAPTAVCQAAVLYVLRCLIAKNIPLNSGSLEPIELIIPEHSILKPTYPAAVVAGNVETSQCRVDTLLGALGVCAASQGTCNNFTFGNEHYQYYETICGGSGAGPDYDGVSAVHTHMTNTRLTDPEVLELSFPVLLEEFSIRKGSGGKGQFHGGDGVIRKIRFLETMTANIISSHREVPPYGLNGGLPGKIGHNWVHRKNGTIEEIGSCGCINLNVGDVFIIETPGGGGFGHINQ